jgi:hypothetical protein
LHVVFSEIVFTEKSSFFYIGSYLNQSKIIEPLTIPFEIGQRNLNDIRLENVTKLQFGDDCSRSYSMY